MDNKPPANRGFKARDYVTALQKHYPELVRADNVAHSDSTFHIGFIKPFLDHADALGADARARFQPLGARSFCMNRNVWAETGARVLDFPRYPSISYKGLLHVKPPEDLVLYSNLLWELQPKTIIEFGPLQGGSSLWFADQLQLVRGDGEGEVHSFEYFIDCIHPDAAHPRLTFHRADLRDLGTLDRALFARLPHPWLVVDDAHENLEQLIPMLASFMKPGDYYVLEDGFAQAANAANIGKAAQLCDALGFMVDTKYADAFGYNVTTSPNGWWRKS